MNPNCNHCDQGKGCRGALTIEAMVTCKKFVPIKGGWELAELALAHPTGLHKALSALPHINVTGYFKEA